MKQVTWAQVTLILGVCTLLLTAVVILAAWERDVSSILTAVALVFATVLSVVGVDAKNKIDHKLDQVKDVANGRLTDALEMIKNQQAQMTELALRITPELPPDKP